MEKFSEWFIVAFKAFFKELGTALKSFFIGIYNIFIGNFIKHTKDFAVASESFKASDWLAAIPSIILIALVYAAFIVLIVQFCRIYFRFVKKEYSKEDLMHEVAVLNYKVTELTDEKNALMAHSSLENLDKDGKKARWLDAKGKANNDVGHNRFVKLSRIDEKYNGEIAPTLMLEEDEISLKDLVIRFVDFAASKMKLYYTPKIIATFFAGMASSKTMILEGISGTGKTSLPYAMGKFFQNDAHIISVQPSWRDRAEMMGYLNEFTKKFNETDFLESLYDATYRTDLNFIVLDEMNLARVEYYFADFLSLLEMPDPSEWLIDVVPDLIAGDPKRLIDGKLLVNQNIWFVGTANKDDSTFTITDKVYDRVASIELSTKAEPINAELTEGIHMSYEYLNSLFESAQSLYKLSDKSKDNLTKLDNFITENFQITFGNRIMKQISTFVPVYIACGGEEVDGLDYLVARKILRKFESLNLPFLQKEIEALIAFINKTFGKNSFMECKKMLNNYYKSI